MIFIVILFLSALSIAAAAGFFSIYGLANIYTAAFWSVVIMGIVLEVGKLVAASFLQRYWTSAGLALKSYLIVAIAGLMIITSAGIFGYLTNAYQKDSIELRDVQSKVELLQIEEQELLVRQKQINEDIGRVGENYVRARIKLMNTYSAEKKEVDNKLAALRQEKHDLSSKQIAVEAHTGPIIYIAKAFDKDVDTAIKWMTILIIIVFDPLAIALTLAGNHALMIRERTPTPPTNVPPPPSKKKEDDFDEVADEETTETWSQQEVDDIHSQAKKTLSEFSQRDLIPDDTLALTDIFDEPTPFVDTEEKLNTAMEKDAPPTKITEQFVVPSARHSRMFNGSKYV